MTSKTKTTVVSANLTRILKEMLDEEARSYKRGTNCKSNLLFFKINIINFAMNSEEDHQAPFQTLYFQLLAQYSSLAQNYHNQSEQNIKLYQQLEGLLQEKINLTEEEIRTQTSIPITPQPPEDSISRQFKQTINYQQQKTIKNKPKAKIENRTYCCPYDDCPLVYRSSVSMNLHIKLKHRGGTKKQRQAVAKILIEAEEKGLPYPEIDLNLPPNFIQEFKKNYEYAKKYNM